MTGLMIWIGVILLLGLVIYGACEAISVAAKVVAARRLRRDTLRSLSELDEPE